MPEKNVEDNKHRLKIAYIADEIIVNIIFSSVYRAKTDAIFLCQNDLPKDVEFVDIHYDYSKIAFAFKLRHKTFDVVPEFEQIPEIKIMNSQYKLLLTKAQIKELEKWQM